MSSSNPFTVALSAREARVLHLLAAGVYAPVDGFMSTQLADAVRNSAHLPDGTPWSEVIELRLRAPAEATHASLKDGEGRSLGTIALAAGVEADGQRRAEGLPRDLPADLELAAQLAHARAATGGAAGFAYAVDSCLHRADIASLQSALPSGAALLLLRVTDCSDEPCHLLHATNLANHAALGHLVAHPVDVLDLPPLRPLPRAHANGSATLARIAMNVADARLLPSAMGASHAEVVRALTTRDETTVARLTWPEVAAPLRAAYLPAGRRGLTILLTGLSGAGKSTIARQLSSTLMTRTLRPVSLLDGDLIRHHLSRGLGFDRADRETNLMRIAFVAREITRHGGIAICAPIAPYASIRARIRDWVSEVGEFVEVHVATPIDICEQRDPKGLYAQARAGELRGFTGIDDPYEAPAQPELRLDTSRLALPESVAAICDYLTRNGYLADGAAAPVAAEERHGVGSHPDVRT